jgi:hypothetical protein
VTAEATKLGLARARPLGNEIPFGRQLLDSVVPGIPYVDVSLGVNQDPPKLPELARPATSSPPLRERLPGRREFLDAAVEGVCDIDVALGIDRYVVGGVELPRAGTSTTPLS